MMRLTNMYVTSPESCVHGAVDRLPLMPISIYIIKRCVCYIFYNIYYHSIKLLTFIRCCQTPPRRSGTDPKPICHFDPLLCGFLYLPWFFDSCLRF